MMPGVIHQKKDTPHYQLNQPFHALLCSCLLRVQQEPCLFQSVNINRPDQGV